jgi:hypothetical protein
MKIEPDFDSALRGRLPNTIHPQLFGIYGTSEGFGLPRKLARSPRVDSGTRLKMGFDFEFPGCFEHLLVVGKYR